MYESCLCVRVHSLFVMQHVPEFFSWLFLFVSIKSIELNVASYRNKVYYSITLFPLYKIPFLVQYYQLWANNKHRSIRKDL